MTIFDFFNINDGKAVDFDNYFGPQCVDLAQFYNRDVLNGPVLTGNAVDIWTTYPKNFYTAIPNTPDNFPSLGDMVIWNTNVGAGNGHIAVAVAGNRDAFSSFDQNWPLNAHCHFQDHTFENVLGWLRPKNLVTSGNDLAIKLQTELDQKNKDYDNLYNQDQDNFHTISQQKDVIDNLNQQINDRNNDITQLNAEKSTLQTQATNLTTQLQIAQEQANKLLDLTKQLNQSESDRLACLKAEDEQQAKIKNLQAQLTAGKPQGFLKKLIFLFS